jgi:hypothetical protein
MAWLVPKQTVVGNLIGPATVVGTIGIPPMVVAGNITGPTTIVGTVGIPPMVVAGNLYQPNTIAGTVGIPTQQVSGGLFAPIPILIQGTIVIPSMNPPDVIDVDMVGGAQTTAVSAPLVFGGHWDVEASGGGIVASGETAQGGALGSGAAAHDNLIPNRLQAVGLGGALGSGAATASSFRPGFYSTLTLISAQLTAETDYIKGDLPLVQSSIDAPPTRIAVIDARLTRVQASAVGGASEIAGTLPLIYAEVTAIAGAEGEIDVTLPTVAASIQGIVGATVTINARLPRSTAALTGQSSPPATIDASLPALNAKLNGHAGAAATINSVLPLPTAAITAGVGGFGTINAELPRVTAQLAIKAGLLTQQIVMVVNTETNAVSTYENYQFNSFCELAGVYYGAGPQGVSQLDVGDDDGLGVPIPAEITTGLLDLGEGYQKRVIDAYMALRTSDELALTVSVDEETFFDPVTRPIPTYARFDLVQRKVAIPKGLRGRVWQFSVSNTTGGDFEFGHLGLNLSTSPRRI